MPHLRLHCVVPGGGLSPDGTHRVAITNHRLLDMDDGQVRFTYKDYRAVPPHPPKPMTLAALPAARRDPMRMSV